MAAIPEPAIGNESSQALRRSQPRSGKVSLRLDDVGVQHSGGWRMVLDLVFVFISAAVVGSFVLHLGSWTQGDSHLVVGWAGTLRQALGPLMLLCAATVWSCSLRGLYSGAWTSHRSSMQVACTVAVATVMVSSLPWVCGIQGVHTSEIACSGILNLVFLTGWRLIDDRLLERRLAKGRGIRNVLIVGADSGGGELASFLESAPQLGYRVKGFLDDHLRGDQVLGTTMDLWRVAGAEFVDEVFVTALQSREVIETITRQAKQEHFDVHLIPHFSSETRSSLNYLGKFPVIALYHEPITPFALCLKRTCDVVISFAGLVLLSPLLALLALAIRLDSPGPVLYLSTRVGKKGRTFTFYKFRTMVSGAEALKEQLRDLNERKGMLFKVRNDPRITRVGRLLRNYSLDELPQLWNVLQGDMSLVGPRPPLLDEYEQYSVDHLRRLSVKPGITGNWQVKGRQEPSFETALLLDLEYINNWSLSFDFKLLMQTVGIVLKGTGC